MKWPRAALLFLLLFPLLARAQTLAPISNFCVNGAKPAITSGLPSSNQNQNLIPNCTVRVFMAGTTTPATIYADNNPTPIPLSNPFTANTDASWTFYVPVPATPGQAQGYDVVLSGGIAPNTYSLPRTLVNLSLGGGFVSGGSGPCPNCVITNPTSSQTVVQPTGSALEVDAGVSNPNPLPNNGTVFKVEDIAPNQNGIDMWSGRVAQIIMNTPDLFNGTDALEMFGGTDGNSQLLLGVSITSGGNVAPHSHNELDGNANDFSGLTYLDPCVNSPGTTNCDGQFNTVFDLSATGAAGGNLNLTLPPVYANFGFAYNPAQGNIVADDFLIVRKTDASANTVTVVPAAGDVIAGGNPVLTAQWQSVMLMGWSPYTGSATHTWSCIGCSSGSGSVSVNGSPVTNPNFNNTTPAAGANFQNVQLQVSGSNISAEVPLAPLVLGFVIGNGVAGTNVGPVLIAARAGSLTKCKIAVKASDGAVPFTIKINKNGTDIFATDPTLAAGASGLSTFTALTPNPLPVAVDDLFTIDITSGSATWAVTIQLE